MDENSFDFRAHLTPEQHAWVESDPDRVKAFTLIGELYTALRNDGASHTKACTIIERFLQTVALLLQQEIIPGGVLEEMFLHSTQNRLN